MAIPAQAWLTIHCQAVKSEFVTPWGVCDLVGISLNQRRVTHRLTLRQVKSIGSIMRTMLLLQIPDVETGKSTTLENLTRDCEPSIPRKIVARETERLIEDQFVVVSKSGRLQKLNGWLPLHDRLIAIELKLSRVEDAMHQALNNLGFAEESFVGLPIQLARRVACNSSRWAHFFASGIGLLGVSPFGCNVLVPARHGHTFLNAAIQFYCVEKFWRTRTKDS